MFVADNVPQPHVLQPEDKERLGDAAQARRKEIDDNRLSRKQAKAASRTRSPAKDRSLPDITIDRQQSHSQASTSGSITMPTGRQTGQKPVHTNSAASRSRKAGSRQSKRGQAAASVIDSSQGGLSSRAKSRASNRSGRHSAWGTHTEASDSGLAVNGKSAGDPFSSESGVGTALGGLVKVSLCAHCNVLACSCICSFALSSLKDTAPLFAHFCTKFVLSQL